MNLSRRLFLKGLLSSTVISVMPLAALESLQAFRIFDLPPEAVMYHPGIGFELGKVIGNQLFPEKPSNLIGPRLADLDTTKVRRRTP